MSLQGGIELKKPDLPAESENKQAAYLRAAMDPDMLSRCEMTIQDWITQTEGLLAETEGTRKEADDAGPDTELVFWRNRMAKFNGVAEQLKSKEARFVLGVAQTAKRSTTRSPIPSTRRKIMLSISPRLKSTQVRWQHSIAMVSRSDIGAQIRSSMDRRSTSLRPYQVFNAPSIEIEEKARNA